ncbi:MAG: trehalose-phosphatase [Solirubrobacterales bacterium]
MQSGQSDALDHWLAATAEHPKRCALFCDVDGTLAPVVKRADDAQVPLAVSRLLGALSAKLLLVACVSGRSASDAKRLVGVGGVVYAGAHGAELLDPSTGELERAPEIQQWREPVRKFIEGFDTADLRRNGVRIEDKDFIQALHWRGADDEEAAEGIVRGIETDAVDRGFEIHRGRMVLEIRPPVHFDKGVVVARLVKTYGATHAAYVGDDVTDIDAFDALLGLESAGTLESALCVGVSSEEQPEQLVERADLMVDGPAGVTELLRAS